ncbi:unnamed protein product, partial [Ectocarpus sp. 13 AM-2016]
VDRFWSATPALRHTVTEFLDSHQDHKGCLLPAEFPRSLSPSEDRNGHPEAPEKSRQASGASGNQGTLQVVCPNYGRTGTKSM